MKSATALELTRGMTYKVSISVVPFMSRKLDHDGWHYDTVDGIVMDENAGTVTIFGFDKVITLSTSQWVIITNRG
jgi:hypothetical protein